MEAQAKMENKGIWATTDGHIEVKHEIGDATSFISTWKGKTVDGTVERVLSGDRMLVRLKLGPKDHVMVMALVAGIKAPSTERTDASGNQIQPAEEFGDEAQKFVEMRLLQRDVKVDILGLSPKKQVIASIKHPNGTIAKFLLEEGLARCVDYHSTMLGHEMVS